jgi:hypothetical protein
MKISKTAGRADCTVMEEDVIPKNNTLEPISKKIVKKRAKALRKWKDQLVDQGAQVFLIE